MSALTESGASRIPAAGTDTPTGTDPDAKYDHPGYEDKSFGQAVNADQELVETLLDEAGGDEGVAEKEFADRSAGAPALHRQAQEADAEPDGDIS